MSAPREHVSLKTKLASALLALGHVPYDDAKRMTADQIISLYHFDHNMLHTFTRNNAFYNLAPMLIAAHREKSKRDKSIITKSDRIVHAETQHRDALELDQTVRPRSRLQSRGFDKRFTRGMDGKVRPRKQRARG